MSNTPHTEPGGDHQELAPESVALAAAPGLPLTAWERIVLTYRYHGARALVLRAVSFPLRFTPLRRFISPQASVARGLGNEARRWYREHGRPVSIVIPSYRDLEDVTALVSSLRATTDASMVRVIVADDASGSEHVAGLHSLGGVEVVAGDHNRGFAANVNRGIRAAGAENDVVVLNSDVIARPGWLESLQYATSTGPDVGIVGAKLLYPDGRIQFAGSVRNPGAPEWFDHRYRFRRSDWGPANVSGPVLAVTGACMYLTRAMLDRVGVFDERFPMAYEDIDLCLRAWQAGFTSMYWPAAQLRHLESVTRGTDVGERERMSQRVFWERWGEFFDVRDVRTPSGSLRIIYVTEGTGVGGGHRVVFEHLNGLRARGHEAELWTLGDPPDWFDLRAPTRTFADYDELERALAPVHAIKVATWWNTAAAVWRASVLTGIPVYFVQDIETTYFSRNQSRQNAVVASYRPEFRYLTTSSWNHDRLRELGFESVVIAPGIDLESFRPLPDTTRRSDMIVALGRSNPLKNLPLTIAGWRALPRPAPELCLFGVEPEVAPAGARYIAAPSDSEVNELFNQATVFVQTSVHEGFCLPLLESMATGGALVCTDAHGNQDFCIDGENCLIPAAEPKAVANAIGRLLGDADLRDRLGQAGIETASRYAWSSKLDELERFMLELAQPREIAPHAGAVPELRRPRAGWIKDPRPPAGRSG